MINIQNITKLFAGQLAVNIPELHINKGDLIGSVAFNPFGLVVSFAMLVLPFWVVFDLVTKRQTFYEAYNKMETVLKQKKVAIPLIILVVLNWIWNIYKEL